jgi:O-antigen/teichoic acid export membrane protein
MRDPLSPEPEMRTPKPALVAKAKSYWQQVRQRTLIVTAGAYVSGYALQKAVNFLLIPLWARFLTPEDYGITGTLFAYSGVLSTVLGLGLYGAVVRHYYDHTERSAQTKSYVTSVALFEMVASGLVILALSAIGPSLWPALTGNSIPFDPYVRIMLWSTYTGLVVQVPVSLYQAQQKARQFVSVQYGRFLLGVLTSILFVVALKMGAYGVLMSQLVSGAIVAAVVLYIAARTWFVRHLAWKYVRAGLSYGLPLVPHGLASWILQASDRVILERFVPLAEVGLYNFGYTLGMGMQFLVMGINQAWSPHYFRLMKADPAAEVKIVRVVSVYIAAIGGVCLAAVLFVGEVVHILMPPRFYGAVPYVAPVLVGYLFLGLYYFASAPLFYYQRTVYVPFLTGFAAALNIGLNLWLIPVFGAIAAAWVTLGTYCVLFVVAFFAGRRYQRIAYPLVKYGILVTLIVASTIAVQHLGILVPWALTAKSAMLVGYCLLAYLLLLSSVVGKR